MDRMNISNQDLSIDEFAELLEEACEKNGWEYDERFGTVYIHTKFESWHFELTRGKIKLMHKNSRYSANYDYHMQWRKFATVRYLVNYIKSHGNKKYLNTKRAYA